MTLTQLKYVVAVADHGNFARAAESCNVTQPTLSMQIRKLEDSMDIQIFDRSSSPVRPTDMGQLIVEQARNALEEIRRIDEVIQEEQNVIKGELRIGIIPTLAPYLLPLFIMEFIEAYPEVDVLVEELLTEQIVAKLRRNELDVGIFVTPYDEEDLQIVPLFHELFVVYMSTRHPLSDRVKINFEDLDLSQMWLLREGHCFRNQVINICGEQHTTEHSRLQFESGSLETLRRIVEREYGYTLLPELATLEMDQDQERFVKYFKNPQPVREVSLVHRRGMARHRLIESLGEEILENIPDILKNPERGKVVEWIDNS